MDTGKFLSVPTYPILHHWTVILLFKVKVNFKIKATIFEMTDIIIFVSVIFLIKKDKTIFCSGLKQSCKHIYGKGIVSHKL